MDLKETINKIKEVIFIKKGIGQPYEVEEKAVKSLEEQIKKEDAEQVAVMKAIEDNEGKIERAEAKIHGLKGKLRDAVTEYRAVAFELFRAEREARGLYDEKYNLFGRAGKDRSKFRRWFQESIKFGNPSNRWVDDDLDPISEEFRRELILDNRVYYGETRGRPRKKPAPEKPQFIPEQAMAMKGAGIELPNWMQKAYDKWLKENPGWWKAPEAR